jgi:bis(5'-nucleosyl)-tetraphosphatase (symmetrical)
MAIYAIGDVQGCVDALRELLAEIGFSAARDRLWFVGDLVNRGPDSVAVLRYVKWLDPRTVVVQGNHDLHLLALAAGHGRRRADDTFDDVLAAPDRAELLEWLRFRPMMHAEDGHVLVHAGLLPSWTVRQAQDLAAEVEAQLRGPRYAEFFAALYGSKPDAWNDRLRGADRLRVIVNAMTRMRFCSAAGVMDFKTKGKPHQAPKGFMPWFEVPGRKTRGVPIICGHWSAAGLRLAPDLLALDTGCVWGGALTAVRLDDRRVFQVQCSPPASSARYAEKTATSTRRSKR